MNFVAYHVRNIHCGKMQGKQFYDHIMHMHDWNAAKFTYYYTLHKPRFIFCCYMASDIPVTHAGPPQL